MNSEVYFNRHSTFLLFIVGFFNPFPPCDGNLKFSKKFATLIYDSVLFISFNHFSQHSIRWLDVLKLSWPYNPFHLS